jgi:ketosteroid isomerase-like protein
MDDALALTKKWDRAVLEKNIDALLDIVADDYQRTFTWGKVVGKEEFRAYLEKSFSEYDLVTARSSELFITPSKGYVVVTGSWKGTLRDGTKLECEWNDARKKINGKWVFTYHDVDVYPKH